MKTITLLFTLLVFAASGQTIRIADNNANAPTGANVYTGANALQNAINAAVPGDIVYVQPSPTVHPEIIIDKRITLRGIGFNTGKDLPLQSQVVAITLTNKDDGTTNASGTNIEGMTVFGVPNVSFGIIRLGVQTGSFGYTLRDITISKCSTSSLGIYRGSGYRPAENITVKDCYTGILFETTGTITNLLVVRNRLYRLTLRGGNLSSAIFSNNLFTHSGGNENVNSFGAGPVTGLGQPLIVSSLIITNNNFLGQNNISANRFMQFDLEDAIVSNNIFYGMAPTSTNGSYQRNAFLNNLTFGTSNDALPPVGNGVGNTGSNNIVGQNPLFVNAPYNTIYASTMDFNLQTTSPAKNAGSDGTDIGITGGAYPVTAGNILLAPTAAPVIMQFNPAALVPQNQPVKANINAKSN